MRGILSGDDISKRVMHAGRLTGANVVTIRVLFADGNPIVQSVPSVTKLEMKRGTGADDIFQMVIDAMSSDSHKTTRARKNGRAKHAKLDGL